MVTLHVSVWEEAIPLNAAETAAPLIECAFTLSGRTKPKASYTTVMHSVSQKARVMGDTLCRAEQASTLLDLSMPCTSARRAVALALRLCSPPLGKQK